MKRTSANASPKPNVSVHTNPITDATNTTRKHKHTSSILTLSDFLSPASPVSPPSKDRHSVALMRSNRSLKSSTMVLVDPQVRLYFSIRKLHLANISSIVQQMEKNHNNTSTTTTTTTTTETNIISNDNRVDVQLVVLQKTMNSKSWVQLGASEVRQLKLEKVDVYTTSPTDVQIELDTISEEEEEEVSSEEDRSSSSMKQNVPPPPPLSVQEEQWSDVRYDLKFNVLTKFNFQSLTPLMFVLVLANQQMFVLGKCETYLGSIVGSKHLSANFRLRRDKLLTAGINVIAKKVNPEQHRASIAHTSVTDGDVFIDLKVRAKHLGHKYSDTFLEVSQLFKQEGKIITDEDINLHTLDEDHCIFIPLYSTETNRLRTSAPKYRPFSLMPQIEEQIVFRFDLFRYSGVSSATEESQKTDHGLSFKTLIGSHILTLEELVQMNKKQQDRSFKLNQVKWTQVDDSEVTQENMKNLVRIRSKKYLRKNVTQSGIIEIRKMNIRREPQFVDHSRFYLNSFLDYMKAGLQFKVVYGIDLTCDNVFPRNDPSLHYDPKSGDYSSIYEKCMQIIGARLNQYSPKNTDFHMVGFGHSHIMSSQNMLDLQSENSDITTDSLRIPSSSTLTGLFSNDERRYSSSTFRSYEDWVRDIIERYEHPIALKEVEQVYRNACVSVQKINEYTHHMGHVPRNTRYMSADFYSHRGSRQVSITDENVFVPATSAEDNGDVPCKTFGPNDFHHLVSDLIELSTHQSEHNKFKRSPKVKELLFGNSLLKFNRPKKKQPSRETKDPSENEEGLQYYILVIMVSNDHIDVQETIYKLVEGMCIQSLYL
jgi:hypothetical protein